ncbi:MAG: putative bifunctional diguanylate cyclase/phosphodiesterase [Acidimicrobiales bacterium]
MTSTQSSSAADAVAVRGHVERIVEGIDGVLWEATWPSLELLYVSPTATRLLGYPVVVWAHAPEFLTSVIHRDDADKIREGCEAAIQSGKNHRTRFRMIAAGGAEVRVQAIVHGVYDPDGVAVGVRGLLLDVTSAAETEDAVAKADRRWRTLLARSNDLSMILDQYGGLIDATPSLERYAGVASAAEFQGPLINMVHPEDRPQVIEAFGRAVTSSPSSTVHIDYRTALAEGGYVWVEVVYANHLDDPNIAGIVCNVRDITARRSAEEALRVAAYTDTLTGLPNRSGLQAALAEAGTDRALFLLDIDGFKDINDTLGHEIGDRVLREAARRLHVCTRPGDAVARLAGDEFAVLAVGCSTEAEMERTASVLLGAFEDAVVLDDVRLRVAVTMGAVLAEASDTPGRILRRADVALERARRQHREWSKWESGDEATASHLSLLADLHSAARDDAIGVAFQPKINLQTGVAIGVETLARWHHPDRGSVSPAEFIPLAEKSGLIRPLTTSVLRQALAAAALWRAEGLELSIAVNLSPTTLNDPDLVDGIARALATSGIPSSALVLELTESALAGSDDATTATLYGLHDLGVRLSIDDFGTGYSVLSYLKRLPITELKIDREFVTHAGTDSRDLAIAASVVDLAHRLGMTVVAEGVEDEATAELMRDIGCDVGQGFGLCQPMPQVDVAPWIIARGASVDLKATPSAP